MSRINADKSELIDAELTQRLFVLDPDGHNIEAIYYSAEA